jgi:choline dehydrogenase
LTRALARRVVIEGNRAVGVEFVRGGSILQARPRREVILSAGAIGSPQLLQLSGVGPGELLGRLWIPVVVANDTDGQNLQDHLAVSYFYKAREPTMNNQLAPWWGKLREGARYLLTGAGPVGISVNQCGGFVRSMPDAPRPDLQLYFAPVTFTTTQKRPGRRQVINPDPWPGYLISFQPARPTSRGRIEIRSPDVSDAPAIWSNGLATQRDLDDVVAGGRLMQAMVRTRALKAFAREAVAPDIETLDDTGLVEDFRQRGGTVFHPVSTCRIARGASQGVVDPQLRVFGIERLRVVDASAFPNLTCGNTNAPTLMLAHRAAEAVLAEAR